MIETPTRTDAPPQPAVGTLFGSRDLRDWQPYVICGQIFLLMFMLVEFGALIPPAIFSTAIAMFGFGVVLISPPGLVMRTPVNLPIVMYLTWYVMSRAWAIDTMWWMRTARREVLLTVALVMVVSVLPVRAVMRTILTSLYIGIALTVFALVTRPGTAAQHVYPGNTQPPLPGWHGTFDHKTGMAMFLVIGLITLLLYERSQLLRVGVSAIIVVLVIGSQSSTGLTLLIFVLGFHVWLRQYVSSRGRRSSPYVLGSAVVGIAGVLFLWALLPTLVESRGKDLTFSGRTLIWSASLDAIAERPWVGYGVGGVWRDALVDPTATMLRKIGFTAFHAHSTVIQLLLDLGAIGLALFLVAYVAAVIGAVKAMRYDSRLASWSLLILGLQFVLSLSEVASWGPWIPMMGAICALNSRAAHDATRHGSDPPRRPAARPSPAMR